LKNGSGCSLNAVTKELKRAQDVYERECRYRHDKKEKAAIKQCDRYKSLEQCERKGRWY